VLPLFVQDLKVLQAFLPMKEMKLLFFMIVIGGHWKPVHYILKKFQCQIAGLGIYVLIIILIQLIADVEFHQPFNADASDRSAIDRTSSVP
jgi:ACR3 family arsenite efflux pump ArsB